MASEQPSEASIFSSARQIRSKDDRDAFLDKACGDNRVLRQRVDQLLAAVGEESEFLERPAAGLVPATDPDPDSSPHNLAASMDVVPHDDEATVFTDSANCSVLRTLCNTLNEVPRISLRDSDAEGPDPLTRPNSLEVPQHRDSESRYRLDGEIARGGMGAIIKGRDTDLGRDLAIKVLLDAHKDKPEVIERFIEEAQIGGQLQHPGIAPIYGLGQFLDGRPFIAMKLVKGQTLSELLAERDSATDERRKFIGIFEQVCRTMAYAHSRGVIHRDLKPANMMVGAFGEVQVMDWGLAKVLRVGGVADEKKSQQLQNGQSFIQTLRSGGSDTPSFGSAGSETRMGSVMGTPAYMPPEQAIGEVDQLDERADVFGLGAILCEILTGKPPYVAEDSTLVYRLACRGNLDDALLRLDACEADEDLIELTKHCLQLDPVDRPRDAGVLSEKISGYLESVEAKLRDAEVERAAEASRADAEAAQAAAERRRAEAESARAGEEVKRRRTSLALAASVLLLVGLGGGGWLYMERQEANRKTAEVEKQTQHAAEMSALAQQRDDQRKAALAAKEVAQAAERKGRELLYATDMQLVAKLLDDERSSAREILSRLNAHDPDSPENVTGGQDLRGFEWDYFRRLVERRSKVFSGFEHPIVAVAVTSNRELVTLESDGTVRCFDLTTRHPIRPAIDLARGRSLGAMALAPDGNRVALAIGGQVMLYNSISGEPIAPPIAAKTTTHGLTFSPDSQMLITVDTSVGWWDANSGAPIAVQDFNLQLGTGFKSPPYVSEDGLVLAVGGQANEGIGDSYSVFKLRRETAEITKLLDQFGGNGGKQVVAISPDGQFLGVGYPYGGNLEIVEAATGRRLQNHLSAHLTTIHRIAFNPDGSQMATASTDGTIKVWENFHELNSYHEARKQGRDTAFETTLAGHAERVEAIGFFDGGKRLFSAGEDKTVRIWDLENRSVSLARSIAGAYMSYRSGFSADGSLIAITSNLHPNGIRLRDASTGDVVSVLSERGDGLAPQSVAFSPDNRLLAIGYGGRPNDSDIELWNIDRAQLLAVLPGSTAIPGYSTTATSGHVTGLAFTRDGKQLVASFGSLDVFPGYGDCPLLVYDVDSRQVVRQLKGHRSTSAAVSFSSDGKRMASASFDGTARIWDTETWDELQVVQNPDVASERGDRRVYDVAFSPDGSLLALASAESNVIIWDVENGTHLQTLKGHAIAVWSVAFSPNGRTLVSASTDGTIRLWNTATWRSLLTLRPPAYISPQSISFSPDGRRILASNGSGDALIWSASEEEVLSTSVDVRWLADLLDSGADFQTRVRMLCEPRQIRELLEELPPEHLSKPIIQAASAASRADWHAVNARWAAAVAEFDHLREIDPDRALEWFPTISLIRLATALLESDRLGTAAEVVAAASAQIDKDGVETNPIGVGYERVTPIRLTEVTPDSPAAISGLRVGDVILRVNDVEPTADHLDDLFSARPGAKLSLQVQRAGSDQQEDIDLTLTRAFTLPGLNTELAKLRSRVEQRFGANPQPPSLFELRAEVNGLLLNAQSQISDYTSAIETLKRQPDKMAKADLQRLYRRRGTAYLNTEKWKQATEDYDNAVTAQSSDDELLANQALARANGLLYDEGWTVLRPLPGEMKSEGGADLTLLEDGSILASGTNPDQDAYHITTRVGQKHITAIRLEALPDASLPINGPGRYPGYGTFHLNEFRVLVNGRPHSPDGIVVSFAEHDQYQRIIDGTVDGNHWSIYPRSGKPHTAVLSADIEMGAGDTLSLELIFSRWDYIQHGLGRFRLSISDDPQAYARANAYQQQIAAQLSDPWHRLAYAYHVVGDQQALDSLLRQHPGAMDAIVNLYVAAENWQPAIECLNQLITDKTTDATLLAKRGSAYISTEQWDLAKADWLRVIELQPGRLVEAFDAFRHAERWGIAAEFGVRLVEKRADLWSPSWLQVATMLTVAEDKTAYQQFCRRMTQKFAESDLMMDADCVLKASLLWDGANEIGQPEADRLARLVDLESDRALRAWGWITQALLAYRRDDAALALDCVAKSEKEDPIDHGRALSRAILAMALHDLGRLDEARTALAESSRLITSLNEYDGPKNHDVLFAEIIFREAKAQMSETPASSDGTTK